MRIAWVLILLSMSGACLAQPVEDAIDATGVKRLVIDVPRGEVEILGHSDTKIAISGYLDEAKTNFIFKVSGERAELRVEMPDNREWHGRQSTQLKVMVPQSQLAVWFNGVATDVLVSGIQNEVRADTVSGDLTLVDLTSTDSMRGLNFSSVSGDISLSRVKGPLVLSNVSGDIQGRADSRDVAVNIISGELELTLGAIEKVNVSAVSGDIHIVGEVPSSGSSDIRMSSVNGEVKLTIGGKFEGRLRMQTGPGGDIVNRLSKHEPESSFIGEEYLKATIGRSGKNEIDLTTVSGTLIVEKP